ncbi:ATP-binding protein [Catellatospora vulcania]|uniref:ATP-binding protein n=1 Tax=Catellatospora vulcania TaxID=1460450 RepID=UPI0012D428B6|nr:tetratricopeptide repeat protein [Catellatospora vulcania]
MDIHDPGAAHPGGPRTRHPEQKPRSDGPPREPGPPERDTPAVGDVRTLDELAGLLRGLRRRHARRTRTPQLSYRDLAASTGWSHGIIGEYLSGRVLPPTDRFDTLVRLLGATPAEQGALATARDRVEEQRRPRATAPHQLPADVPAFTGRDAQLSALDALHMPGCPTVSVVSGTGGVGKTALALHWAHRAAARFPDGQLHLDLRGYAPGQPLPAVDALGMLLRALGLGRAAIPAGVDERAAAYRSLLAGRRMLVLLDNAHSAAQVRPLLPGTAGCAVLVTSRDDLAGLVARDGAHRIRLDALPPTDAVALLRTLLGTRVDAEPAAAAALASRCAGLPLALRVATEVATARPDATLEHIAAELTGADALDTLQLPGDPPSAVRTVLSWSHRHLSPPAAHAFALLGLYPGRDVDAPALAALADATTDAAARALDDLTRAHLVERSPTGHTMHDLLRAYAGERALAELTIPRRRDAITRLLRHHLDATAAAMDLLFPHEHPTRPTVAAPHRPLPFPAEPAAARRWLDTRRGELVRLAVFAAGHDRATDSAGLSTLLWRYLEVGGHHEEALAVHAGALAALAPHAAERAAVLANLGTIHWWLGAYDQARTELTESATGFAAAGDRPGQARALSRLAAVHERLGAYADAMACLGTALMLCRAAEDRHGEAAMLLNRGSLHRRLGRHARAAAHHRRAAAIFADLGDLRLEGYALGNLGVTYEQLGRYHEAETALTRALDGCRAAGDPAGQGSALAALASVHRHTGRPAEALDDLGRALALGRDTSDRGLETESLNGLGETLRTLGRPGDALERHRAALDLAEHTGDRFEQARALEGIGDALAAQAAAGQVPGAAREHWRRALTIYTELGVPQARPLRERTCPTEAKRPCTTR